MTHYDYFVGIDWGYETHQACLIDNHGKTVAERSFGHGQGLGELGQWLTHNARGTTVAVAIETPHAPVVEAMMEQDHAVHSLNPRQLDRFHDRLSRSGTKDDRRDARVLAISLHTDPHCFRKLEPSSAEIKFSKRIASGIGYWKECRIILSGTPWH